MEWPTISPDLNPTENRWDHIDKELGKLKPTNLSQLQDMIEDLWLCITSSQCQELVGSMPHRIETCIRSRG